MIRFIAAIDQKHGLAKNGHQPWHLPTDEKYFLDQTQKFGGVVVMGHTTYTAIGHPLVERRNIVLSRTPQVIRGVEVMTDVQEALQAAPDIWVIGGAVIFEHTLSAADELYLTHIDADFDCDQFFPAYTNQFELVSQSSLQHENGLDFTFCVYKKKKGSHEQNLQAS